MSLGGGYTSQGGYFPSLESSQCKVKISALGSTILSLHESDLHYAKLNPLYAPINDILYFSGVPENWKLHHYYVAGINVFFCEYGFAQLYI